jgi:hypothetical protein
VIYNAVQKLFWELRTLVKFVWELLAVLFQCNSPKLKWTRHTRDQEKTALTYYYDDTVVL